jgi:hypothetical protein
LCPTPICTRLGSTLEALWFKWIFPKESCGIFEGSTPGEIVFDLF